MLLTDHIALDARTVRETRDGYLVAEARVARTGIQTYTAAELGLTDRKPSDVVRVYRSPEEVFDKASMESFTWRPMTNDHPSEMVTADSWKKVAVGITGDRAKREVADDGEYLVVPLTLMDRDAISDYRAGKRQLSNGYVCSLDWTPGTTPNGEAFDARQIAPRGNHIALCDNARGGSKLTFGDAYTPSREEVRTFFDSVSPSKETPAMKTLIIDGIPVADVSPAAEAVILKLQGQVTDAAAKVTAADAKVAELTTLNATKDAEIATLKTQLADAAITPAKLQDAAKAYATVVAQAKALGVTATDGLDTDALKVAVVNSKLGDAAKGWTADQIATSFATLASTVKVADAADPLAAVLGDTINTGDAESKAVTDAYNAMVAEMRGEKAAA